MSHRAHQLADRWTLAQLIPLLAQTIGEEKARDVIETAAEGLGLSVKDGLLGAEVLALLDEIATTPGIVGITARFAKSRVHLSRRP
ncbi:MAG: hypothetical protein AB8I08_26190 [Sandaracinaceae bacterium]